MSKGGVPDCVKLKPGDKAAKCLLCFSTDNDPFLYGDLYQCGKIVAHYFCLLFSSSLVQTGADNEGILGFMPADITKEIRRGGRLKCSYCRKNGATIGCQRKSCKKSFHLPCGLKKESMHQYFDQFLSFCSNDRPQQKVDTAVEDDDVQICPICYESVSNMVSNQTLWAPCCRRRWFHRVCLQRQALAQGYFFKCPTCNNNDIFATEMKNFGIYVPEMDAAWEREPNAFRDLLISYKNCDAPVCKCTEEEGRKHSQNTGSWRLLRCNSCGSQGTHIACSSLKLTALNNSWSCSTCMEVINKGRLIKQESSKPRPHASAAALRLGSSSPTLSGSSSQHVSFNSTVSIRRPAHPNQEIQANKKRRSSPPLSDKDTTVNQAKPHSDSEDEVIDVCDDDSDVEVLCDRHTIITNEGKQVQVHNVIAPIKEETREVAPNYSVHPMHVPVYWIPVNIGGQPAFQPVVPVNPYSSMLHQQASTDVINLD